MSGRWTPWVTCGVEPVRSGHMATCVLFLCRYDALSLGCRLSMASRRRRPPAHHAGRPVTRTPGRSPACGPNAASVRAALPLPTGAAAASNLSARSRDEFKIGAGFLSVRAYVTRVAQGAPMGRVRRG